MFKPKPNPNPPDHNKKVQMNQKAKTCKDCRGYVYCPDANRRVATERQVCWLFE